MLLWDLNHLETGVLKLLFSYKALEILPEGSVNRKKSEMLSKCFAFPQVQRKAHKTKDGNPAFALDSVILLRLHIKTSIRHNMSLSPHCCF